MRLPSLKTALSLGTLVALGGCVSGAIEDAPHSDGAGAGTSGGAASSGGSGNTTQGGGGKVTAGGSNQAGAGKRAGG